MKSSLLNLVEQNQCEKVLKKLKTHFQKIDNEDGVNEVILIRSKLTRNKKEKREGIYEKNMIDKTYGLITKQIIDLISTLDADDITGATKNVEEIQRLTASRKLSSQDYTWQGVAQWLSTNRFRESNRIISKLSDTTKYEDYSLNLFRIELINAHLYLAEAFANKSKAKLDNPEDIFEYHLSYKTLCQEALDLLYHNIPSEFEKTERQELNELIKYLKGQVIKY